MAGLMAKATALETAGALQGMKVPVVHDPMYLEFHPTAEPPEDVGWMSPSADSVLCSSSTEATKCSLK